MNVKGLTPDHLKSHLQVWSSTRTSTLVLHNYTNVQLSVLELTNTKLFRIYFLQQRMRKKLRNDISAGEIMGHGMIFCSISS